MIMKGFIAEGRFDHAHYIKLWSKRLEEMGVAIDGNFCDETAAPAVQAAPADSAPAQPPPHKTNVAASMKKTRGALLGGLRSGKLEGAVAKMEADLQEDEVETRPPPLQSEPVPSLAPAPLAATPSRRVVFDGSESDEQMRKHRGYKNTPFHTYRVPVCLHKKA